MFGYLNQSLMDYLKENWVLAVILGVIILIVIALVITMIVLSVKEKKAQAAEEPVEETKEEPAEETKEEPVVEETKEEPVPVVAEEAPAEETKEEPVVEETKEEPAPVVEEEAPVEEKKEEPVAEEKQEPVKEEKKEPAPAKKPAAKPAAKPAPAKKPAAKKAAPVVVPVEEKKPSAAGGKWVIYKEGAKFAFRLVASNGEVMLTSATPYASLASAKTGIQTYKNNIAKDENVQVEETKTGSFFVRILSARGGLLANSADYKTKASAENAGESIKRWAQSETIVVETEEA